MKKLYLILLIILLGAQVNVFAQTNGGVSIGKGDADAHPSAILELVSSDKGLLIPRMTSIQRQGIQSPAEGLLVYDTSLSSFFVWGKSGWNFIPSGTIAAGNTPPESSNNQFFFNTGDKTLYANVSGVWVPALANIVDKNTTINGHPLTGNIVLKTSELVNDAGFINGANVVPKTTTINGLPLTGNITLTTNQLVNNAGFLTVEGDGSITNELQTLSVATNTITLSSPHPMFGGSFTLAGAGGNTVTTSGHTITITGSVAPDATTAAKGKIMLAGDLGGTADLPTVPALATKEASANKSTDVSTDGTSDIKYPTVKAVKTYVDNLIPTGVADADGSTKGKVKLTNDLGGTADLPTVPGLALKAPLASPLLTGTPIAPTAAAGTNTDQIATTKFVLTNGGKATTGSGSPTTVEAAGTTYYDTLNNIMYVSDGSTWQPLSTGGSSITTVPAVPKAGDVYYNTSDKNIYYYDGAGTWLKLNGTNTGAGTPSGTGTSGQTYYDTTNNTFYVYDSTSSTWNSVNSVTVDNVLTSTSTTNALSAAMGKALSDADVLKAPLASPVLTGIPEAPTAAAGTSTTQIATTAFVAGSLASGVPDAMTTATGKVQLAGDLGGTGSTAAAPVITNNAITTAKILDANVTDSKIATVSGTKVTGSISGNAANVTGVVAIANGGTGSSTQNFVDLTTAQTIGGAKTLSGNTTVGGTLTVTGVTTLTSAPVLSSTTASQALFTDAGKNVVSNAITGTGNVVMSDSPSLTGIPVAPTAAAGTSTTQIATTAFVAGSLASGAPDATTTATGKVQLAGDLGGTGSTAAAPVITDNAITTAKILDTNVTDSKIATVSGTKVTGSISGNAANVTGVVAIANGGTGSSTQNFVDLTTAQTIGGAKTLSSAPTVTPFSTAGVVHNSAAGLLSSSTIVDADVNTSAAIAGTKIAPDFGSQLVTTTGAVAGASFTAGSGTGTTAGSIVLNDATAGTSNTVTVQTPANVTTSYALTLPVAQGAANTVLSNNGTGVLSWTSASAAEPWYNVATSTPATANTQNVYIMGYVGVGTASPVYKLDLGGTSTSAADRTIAISGTPMVYLPVQGTAVGQFDGSLAVGDGLRNLVNDDSERGRNNTSVGIGSLNANTTGLQNTAQGTYSLYSNTEGSGNTANGTGAMYSNTSGSLNTTNGGVALFSNTTGQNNTANGYETLNHNTTGSYNTAIGFSALHTNNGSGNTALGSEAGRGITTGNDNIAIGSSQDLMDGTANNQLNIGGAIFGTGLSGNEMIPAGNIGIGVLAPTARLHLPAGIGTSGTAPLKLTSGINLTTPEDGAVEFDGAHYYGTVGTTRYQLDQQATGAVTAIGGIDSQTKADNGAVISGNNLVFQTADGSKPGLISTGTQIFAGAKTFSSAPTLSTINSGSVLFAGTGGLVSEDNSNLYWDSSNHRLGIGTTSPNNSMQIYTTSGLDAGLTITNMGSSSTDVAAVKLTNSGAAFSTIFQANANHATVPNAMGFFTNGANGLVFYPDGYRAFRVNKFVSYFYGDGEAGSVGIGIDSPTAALHLKAGSAAAGSAPLKLTSGTNLTTTEAGAVEYDGSHLYFTAADAGTRYQLDGQGWVSTGNDISNLNSGNVGIGTATPTGKLDIASGQALFADGALDAPSIGFRNSTDTKTGFYRSGPYGLGISAGNGYSWIFDEWLTAGTSSSGIKGGLAGTALAPIFTFGGAYSNAGMYRVNDGTSNLQFSTSGTNRIAVLANGNVGIGTTAPTAALELKAGTAAAGTAPLKLTSGTNLTTPEDGAVEFDGTHYYGTVGTTRYQLDQQATGSVTAIGAVDAQAKAANGAVVSGTNLVLQTADDTYPGLVSTAMQTFAGSKSFTAASDPLLLAGGVSTQPASVAYSELVMDNTTGAIRKAPVINALDDVIENTVADPGTLTPAAGDKYIVSAAAVGDWAGKVNQIASWSGAAWGFYAPATNDRTTVTTGANVGNIYTYNGTVWVIAPVSPTTNWLLTGNIGAGKFIGTTDASDLVMKTNNTTRMTVTSTGYVGIGTTTPTAALHLKAGTAAAGTAPLKLTSGTNLGTTEAGAIEFNGSHLYFSPTNGGTRYQLDGSVTTLTLPSGTNANGGTITGNTLQLSLADATNPGLVSTGAQTFLGVKTFTNNVAITGGSLTTTAATANLFNTAATTLNIGNAATTLTMGNAATTLTMGGVTGTTTIRNTLNLLNGNLTSGNSTSNLFNSGVLVLNIGGGATDITMGASTGTTVVNNNLQVKGGALALGDPIGTTAANIALFDASGTSTAITLQSPAALSASYSMTLPEADGTAGQVLKTDGAGNLGWTNTESIASKTADYTLTATDNTIVSSNGATMTLPAASSLTGKIFRFVSGGGTSTISGSMVLSGGALFSYGLNTSDGGRGITVQSDGLDWIIISRF